MKMGRGRKPIQRILQVFDLCGIPSLQASQVVSQGPTELQDSRKNQMGIDIRHRVPHFVRARTGTTLHVSSASTGMRKQPLDGG